MSNLHKTNITLIIKNLSKNSNQVSLLMDSSQTHSLTSRITESYEDRTIDERKRITKSNFIFF